MSRRQRTPRPRDSQQEEATIARPIPSFYCAYLLRSTVRHASLYIGSTPDPKRRIAQHNGHRNGGAKRTSRDTLRPWEMVALVSGFTSRIGALQFEWAWQHTQGSRHAGPSQSTTVARSGRSLGTILYNLHVLLRSKYFSSWPLEAHFLNEQASQEWERQRTKFADPMGASIAITQHWKTDTNACVPNKALLSFDTEYKNLKDYLEKSRSMLQHLAQNGEEQKQTQTREVATKLDCGVCKKRFAPQEDELIVVCSHEHCKCATHLMCLSTRFLEEEEEKSLIIPKGGRCPGCRMEVKWPVLMKELTLRLRGENEVKKVLKKRRVPVKTAGQTERAKAVAVIDEEDEVEEEEENDVMVSQPSRMDGAYSQEELSPPPTLESPAKFAGSQDTSFSEGGSPTEPGLYERLEEVEDILGIRKATKQSGQPRYEEPTVIVID